MVRDTSEGGGDMHKQICSHKQRRNRLLLLISLNAELCRSCSVYKIYLSVFLEEQSPCIYFATLEAED